jgi:spore maturation protein CgeB
MRIFCAVRHAADPRLFSSALWSSNFYPALRSLGCEIIESQVDLAHNSKFMGITKDFTAEEQEARSATTRKILDEVRSAHQHRPLQLFLSYFYNSHFDPAGFDELRRLEIPSVNFYCNSMHQFDNVAQIANAADISWHTERDARPFYLAAGARPVWVQMGADPEIYRPIDAGPRQAKVCFVGQRYADRDRWLASLVSADVPIAIYGSGWGPAAAAEASSDSPGAVHLGRRQSTPGSWPSYVQVIGDTMHRQGAVTGAARLMVLWQYRRETRRLLTLLAPFAEGRAADLPSTFARHEVCLNLANVWADGWPGSSLIPHVRLRDFEAPMCGACYLTGHSDEIEEFYEVGKEIDTYRTQGELIDKARHYLRNHGSAERLREAGIRRARRDHTWKRRFEQLFHAIGIDSRVTANSA